jgi:DNA polymerase-3 subunit alpha
MALIAAGHANKSSAGDARRARFMSRWLEAAAIRRAGGEVHVGSPVRCVHLHVHSHFSLLDGNPTIPGLVEAAKRDGMDALALTDHGNLYGAVEFMREARAAGVKPIPGMEAYIARKSRLEKSGADGGNFTDHITLLAATAEGWQNLMKLTSLSFIDGFYRKPRIDKELLAAHGKGLIALSGCLSGEVARAVEHGERSDVVAAACGLRDLFGRDNFYLEVMNNGLERQNRVRAALREVSAETGIPLVGTSDVHYLRREDARAQEVMLAINTGNTMQDSDRMRMESDQFHFRSGEEMSRAFADTPGALERTCEIAGRCGFQLALGEMHLPTFKTPDGSPPADHFRRICEEGVKRRYPDADSRVRERLEREIAVITQMGFVSYFLIVWDFIRFARENGVPVGPGRGSAAGSIVAYCLGITNVDPLKYDLLFERFLNSSRISMPDIDVDFCRDGRAKVIEYVRERYGAERVSQIVTFGTLAAKAAIRDAGRVLGIELRDVDRIAKKIPTVPGTELEKALEDPELQAIRAEGPRFAELFDVALKIEGLNRHASTHAAGVVIGDRPLMEIVPLCTVQGEVNTQFTMNDLEALGLLKMDFLGLKTLTILDQAGRLIRRNHGRTVVYDEVPLDDRKTFELLQKGETSAVFQLESPGMKELLVKMRPDCFEDIIAILALYRPGPLGSGMVDSFVNRKRGVEPVRYAHPSLEPILRETYGIMVYQEQVMRIANVLAGFSLDEADTLRKAMSKKKLEVMAKYRQHFVDGAAARGCARDVATAIWEQIEFFAGYGFNKSHSTAYGLVTWWTAWVKANYPQEFWAAVITCDSANTDKVAAYLGECRRAGIDVLPPDLMRSELETTIDGRAIRLGLGNVKGIGPRAIEELVAARRSFGREPDLPALLESVPAQSVNRVALEALVDAGALDWTRSTRAALHGALDTLMQEAAAAQRDRRSGQKQLFGLGAGSKAAPAAAAAPAPARSRIPPAPEWPEREKLRREKEALGFFLSSNPLARYSDVLMRHCTARIDDLDGVPDGATVTVGGIAGKPRVTVAKRGRSAGKKMAIVEICGLAGAVTAVVFPEIYERVHALIEEDRILLVTGQLDRSSERPSIKSTDVRALDGAMTGAAGGHLVVDLPASRGDLKVVLDRVQQILGRNKGESPVFFRLAADGRTPIVHRADERWFVRISDDLVEALERELGPGTASLR